MQLKQSRFSQAPLRIAQLVGWSGRASNARSSRPEPNVRARLLWTLGNLCMLIGVVLLLYVGGVYSQAEYERYAARGDTDLPAPPAVSAPEQADEPAPFVAPILNASDTATDAEGQIVSPLPTNQAPHASTVNR